jgi:DNA mismatch repair protein MutH
VNSRPDKVVRGIAGDVIEVSVLGCGRDSRPEPDILVDGVRTELKTTGLQKPRKRSAKEYEPKEPLTITNISPETLKHETFDNSRFYHKIEHLLFVFYHYALTETAKNSGDYSIFPILGHLFWEAVDNDLEALRNDWHLVQDFVRQHKFDEDDARRKLKENLMLIDYSSPKQPRFRFKKTFVSTIVDRFLQQRKYEVLPEQITRFSEIDDKCHLFTAKYKGKTLSELCSILGIQLKDGDKDACQRIIIKMFGGQAKSINQIEDFNKIGLIAKTLILTSDGKKTEDTKLFRVDFDEWCNSNTVFDEQEYSQDSLFYNGYSQEYSYFAEHSFIFTLFEEPHAGKNIPLSDCKFLGFKRYSFNDNFINTEVRSTWEIVRDLVINKKLTETKGARGYAPNFPKGKQHTIFLRGSGSTSKDRKERLKDWGIDIKMYIQWAWIKGDYIVEELSKVPFL